jgi:hypothetical protein
MDTEFSMPDLDAVLKSALKPDTSDRALLAEGLLASLDAGEELDEAEADRLWAEEAQKRLKEATSGRRRVRAQ